MAKKKVTLPFVVAPRHEPIMHECGSEESGKIEIKRRGYLTVAEKSFMQQAVAGDETIATLHRLAGKIGTKAGLQTSEVMEILGQGDLNHPALAGFETEITDVMSMMSTYEQRTKAVAAACLVFFRISNDFGIEDVMELHPDIVDDLYLLYLMEDQKSTEGFEVEEEAPKSDSSK